MEVLILLGKFALILWLGLSQIRAARRPSAAAKAETAAPDDAPAPAFTASRAA